MVTDNLHNAVRICFFRSGWAFLALFCVCSFSAPASRAQKSTPASVPFGARSQSGFPAGDAVVSVLVNVREIRRRSVTRERHRQTVVGL